MSEKALILCVDDEPVNISIIEELLGEEYRVVTADSGEACLQCVDQEIPQLILLDVNMPNIDGLETCQRLKQNPAQADIPVVFISALASDEELMAGYMAGGDDYITKPFSGEILQRKIEIVLASQRSKQQYKAISEDAAEALSENLSSSGELALVVKFLQDSFSITSLPLLAARVFECLAEFKLDCSLLILSQPENLFWFSDEIDRPMEKQILESLHGQDRLVSFGRRLAINSDMATILIRNIPSEGDKAARLRDHMSILIEGLDSRIRSLQAEERLQQRRLELTDLLGAGRQNIEEIQQLHRQRQESASKFLSQPGGIIENYLLQLDLDAKQQTILAQMTGKAEKRIALIFEEAASIDAQFVDVIEELCAALEHQTV